ncbi:MAG TPA: EF-hand domain-containing protein [Verrucomicrobiae bacterium]|jgi:Ca2+-binding EF-hand superfamily protein
MNTKIKMMLVSMVISAATFAACAQDDDRNGPPPGGPGGGGMGGHRPPMPAILRALDANHDGVIDADEIANASAALKTLDKNGDGKLTADEYLGKRPGRPGGKEGEDVSTNDTAKPFGNDGPDGGHGPGHRHQPVPPIVRALDANHDGVIDADEIANASTVLKTLDKNGDGKLTHDEYMGKRPGPPPQAGNDDNDGNGAGGPPPEDAPPMQQ